MRTTRTVAAAGLAGGAAAAAGWMCVHLRSPAVRNWRPSELAGMRVGRLFCRTGGSGPPASLLLHGLMATGDVFGRTADALALDGVVAVPDLLGFGRSLDEASHDFGTEAHLAAISEVVDQLCGRGPVRLGAHSMGSTLALRWAARHPGRVERVVCLGAPLWPRATDALGAIAAAGPMARAFLLDERVAGRLCALNCRYRTAGGWVGAALAPRWPVPVARQASLHSWAAYQAGIAEHVLHDDWRPLLARLDGEGVPVRLVWGDHDRIGDPAHARRLTDDLPHVSVETVAGADHTLPAARPDVLPPRLAGTC